jgi:hypothetical protein
MRAVYFLVGNADALDSKLADALDSKLADYQVIFSRAICE